MFAHSASISGRNGEALDGFQRGHVDPGVGALGAQDPQDVAGPVGPAHGRTHHRRRVGWPISFARLSSVAHRTATDAPRFRRIGQRRGLPARRLDVLTGKVIGQCLPRHRNGEFLRFLHTIDRQVPKGLAVHLILDNYGTHNHPNVKAWLAKHPRFHLHFTPTSSSWLNLVERWFRDLTGKAIRRGVFRSVPELIAAIDEYLRVHNGDPKPFVWTATAESIPDKVRRGRVTLEQVKNQN
jgi:transposase